MPPHLHPRSTATSTLFAGTLLASFVVVAIPHLAPCPRPHGRNHLNTELQLDSNGKPIKKAARKTTSTPELDTQSTQSLQTPAKTLDNEAAMFKQLQAEAAVLKQDSHDRECPVPKPGGVLGKWLGFSGGRAVAKD